MPSSFSESVTSSVAHPKILPHEIKINTENQAAKQHRRSMNDNVFDPRDFCALSSGIGLGHLQPVSDKIQVSDSLPVIHDNETILSDKAHDPLTTTAYHDPKDHSLNLEGSQGNTLPAIMSGGKIQQLGAMIFPLTRWIGHTTTRYVLPSISFLTKWVGTRSSSPELEHQEQKIGLIPKKVTAGSFSVFDHQSQPNNQSYPNKTFLWLMRHFVDITCAFILFNVIAFCGVLTKVGGLSPQDFLLSYTGFGWLMNFVFAYALLLVMYGFCALFQIPTAGKIIWPNEKKKDEKKIKKNPPLST
ncbi:MAG: hypothetical protein OXC40_02345 [Proteobacteria bacterium]|nr:hypothetical protein [Pseudomonadota bacterium]